jgi:hypothetical protein
MLFDNFLIIIAFLVMSRMMIGDVKFMNSVVELKLSLQAEKVNDNIVKIVLNIIIGFLGFWALVDIAHVSCPELIVPIIFFEIAFVIKFACNMGALIGKPSPGRNF